MRDNLVAANEEFTLEFDQMVFIVMIVFNDYDLT
jgi:hypothetical protein